MQANLRLWPDGANFTKQRRSQHYIRYVFANMVLKRETETNAAGSVWLINS